MLTYEEALKAILAEPAQLGMEELGLEAALGRVLATDAVAAFDVPAFDNSAMDGYAVACPVEGQLRVVGEIRAGNAGDGEVRPGTAMRVFTGARIPSGANAVVMQEYVERDGDSIWVKGPVHEGDYIRRSGSEVKYGEGLFGPGTPLSPSILGYLAATGNRHVQVWARPVVAVIETGDELTVDLDQIHAGAGVYPSNGIALGTALESLGCDVHRFHALDTRQALADVLSRALESCDVVLSTGGVSVGDYDLVRAAYLDLGVEERLWRVAIRPGKPLFFGRRRGGPIVFGLPGNPASAMVTFLLFVKPLLMKMFGLPVASVRLRLGQDVEPAPAVDTFMRVTVQGGVATPVEKQGSNMISSVAKANALIQIPMGDSVVLKGTELNAIPISWSLFG